MDHTKPSSQEAVAAGNPSPPAVVAMASLNPHMIRAADIVDTPDMVAPLPYLNFLRYLKRNFYRRYGLRRLLRVGLTNWTALSDAQKRKFEPQVRCQ